MLYLHGNAQSVFEWALVRRDLDALACGLLLIDYPGYGKSTGSPSEPALYAAGRAALDWLAVRRRIDERRIIVHGKSLGGGVATEVARQRRLLGVQVEDFDGYPLPGRAFFATVRYVWRSAP